MRTVEVVVAARIFRRGSTRRGRGSTGGALSPHASITAPRRRALSYLDFRVGAEALGFAERFAGNVLGPVHAEKRGLDRHPAQLPRAIERSRKREAVAPGRNDVGDQEIDRLARPEQRLGFVRTRCGLYR